MALRGMLLLAVLSLPAFAGEKYLRNDTFSGSGSVGRVPFDEYEGSGVILRPAPSDYPIKIIAIDVLFVSYPSGTGDYGAYLVDIWKQLPDGGFSDGSSQAEFNGSFQIITSSSAMNRIPVSPAVVLDAGSVAIRIGTETCTVCSTNLPDNTTIAFDQGPVADGGVNRWWNPGLGWDAVDGVNHSVTGNWIIRAVLETPDSTTVTSITPNSGINNVTTDVNIAGSHFLGTAKAFVGSTQLSVTSITTSTIAATVPSGLTAGVYDVRVENSSTDFATLAQAFTVQPGNSGSTGGGSGGSGGSGGGGGAGGGTGGSSGGSGGSGGGSATGGGSGVVLSLSSITPQEGYADDDTKVAVLGTGFESGTQVLVGSTAMTGLEVKSPAVLNAVVPKGIEPGSYDVTAVNPDGSHATWPMGFTVYKGSKIKPSSCGCSSDAGLLSLAALAVLRALRRRRAILALA